MNESNTTSDSNNSLFGAVAGDESVQRSVIAVGVTVIVAVARHYLFGKGS